MSTIGITIATKNDRDFNILLNISWQQGSGGGSQRTLALVQIYNCVGPPTFVRLSELRIPRRSDRTRGYALRQMKSRQTARGYSFRKATIGSILVAFVAGT